MSVPSTLEPDEAAVLGRYDFTLSAIKRTQRGDGPRRALTASQMGVRASL